MCFLEMERKNSLIFYQFKQKKIKKVRKVSGIALAIEMLMFLIIISIFVGIMIDIFISRWKRAGMMGLILCIVVVIARIYMESYK